jgi:signal transduction histidine kinase
MNLFAISGLVCGIFSTILALIAFIFGRSKIHRILTCFNLSVAVWGYGCFIAGIASTESAALYGWRFGQVGGTFIAVFFYHMVCIFCELQRRVSLRLFYIWGLIYLYFCFSTKFLFANTWVTPNVHYNDATSLSTTLVISWLFIVCLSFFEILRFFPKTKGIKRTQTLYLIVGFLTGFIGGASTLIPMFNINFPPFGNVTIPIYCMISTYAILRYRLMDINLVFRKGMVYSLSAGILTGLFVVLVLTMTKFLSEISGISSFAITTASALIIAFLFNPLKNKVQSFIDKSFYKNTYDYYPIIRKVSRKLTSIFDINELFNYVGGVIFSTLRLSNIYLLSAVPGSGYEIAYHKSTKKDKDKKTKEISENEGDGLTIRKNSELVKFFRKSDDVLIKDELPGLEKSLGYQLIEHINNDLEPFEGEAVVPVFTDKKLILLIVLGEKLSGDMFTNEDLNFLGIISNQIAISIKNTQLYKDKVDSEKLASIGMMSATFAHEVRNPLTSLKTFAQLMPERHDDEEFREVFSKIVVNDIEKIDGLINDLLDFSSARKSARVNNFNLTKLIDEMIEYVNGKIDFEQKHIAFEKKYDDHEIPMTGDQNRLKRVFSNIMNNGCQAMDGDGVLTVDIRPNGKMVEISIADTGRGIPPENISTIFDPFVTTKEMGVGLGLAICKRIVEDHKGKISVQSKLEKGTTFKISLPLQVE